MGKPTGFMEYDRCEARSVEPKERIKNFDEFHIFLSKEKQREQAARCMDCGVPFCQSGMTVAGMTSGCPLHNLVPEWNDLLYTGNYQQAYNRLHKTNNFPEFTSRVCPALCEKACTCGHWGDPVSVRDNEHGIIETAYKEGYAGPHIPKVRTGKKVAIIGSGPSGLAAADQLNQRGHEVTVYERDDRVGGLLMYGIPNMKLEKQIIDRKINVMKEEGVKFITGCNVGVDVKSAELLKEYDRVILCCGAKHARDIKAAGRDAEGIYFAVDYLSRNTKSLLDSNFKDNKFISAKGKNVVIIGGGDTGNDCVGTAIRQGAKSVTQLEMMPCPPAERAANNPWPEWPKVLKTDYGQEEAIACFGTDPRIYQTTVKEFHKDKNGKLNGLTIVRLESKVDEKTGRRNMVEVSGSEKKIPAELVLIAAGFLGTEEYIAKAFGVELNQRTNVATEPGTYATNVKNVFVAGDMHRGQSLVVWAIREGREVAHDVDTSLITSENISATVSNEMRRDAIVAVIVAAIFMLLYIWFRFKDIRFAGSAVLALLHDVLVVLTFYAISRISVGNTFIACMLTIVGYSINATIVIFDRIRENLHGSKRVDELEEVVNKSITQTLTRSIYTSLTTFIMVAVLYIMGVSSIREFAAPLMVGIICGAYSSVCITGALWLVMKKKIGGGQAQTVKATAGAAPGKQSASSAKVPSAPVANGQAQPKKKNRKRVQERLAAQEAAKNTENGSSEEDR